MSDNPNPGAPPVVLQHAPAPSSNLPVGDMVKWGAAVAVGASVLVLAILGKVPVDTYINLVVYPTFGLLGVHTIAKNLN